MKKVILYLFGDFIAKFYLSIIKPSIDNYFTKTQLKKSVVGVKTIFFQKGIIFFPEKFKIGNYCRVGENYFFHAKGGLEIGNNTILSRNVTIYTANHNFLDLETMPYSDNYIEKSVIIGNSVWIGMNVSILPGVTIGDGAIIGMGSIITKNINPGEIVVGSSQRVVSSRKFENIDIFNNEINFYGKKFN
jgi:acetyltransferase-like isoleucine patch superfamily enzyme